MRIFRINEDRQNQFAELPEIAMDLSFGQSDSNYFLVVSCAMAIPLEGNIFTEPEASFFLFGDTQNASRNAQTRTFMNWFRSRPVIDSISTASPQQAWPSFMGAIGPVTPIGILPSPPPPPSSIFGHLPFKAKTLADTVIYRWRLTQLVEGLTSLQGLLRRTHVQRQSRRFLSRQPASRRSGLCIAEPHAGLLPMVDIRRTIDDFHLDVQIVQDDGHEKLLFEGSLEKRWLILKLLDDDYLGSIMTHERYEVNSKSAVG